MLKKTFFKIWKTEISKFVSKDFMGGLILYWYIEESYSKFFSKHLWMFWFFIDISRKVIHFVIRLNQKFSSFILFQDSNCAFSVTRPSLFLFYQSGINLVTIINFKYVIHHLHKPMTSLLNISNNPFRINNSTNSQMTCQNHHYHLSLSIVQYQWIIKDFLLSGRLL